MYSNLIIHCTGIKNQSKDVSNSDSNDNSDNDRW